MHPTRATRCKLDWRWTTLQPKVVSINCTLCNSCFCAGVSHQPALPICPDLGAVSWRFWRRLHFAKAFMKAPIPAAGPREDFVSQEDEGLFAYINTLRLSVKERVAAEQQRGLSLSEIVVQVREMVRVAEEDAQRPKPFPSRAFRAISREALAWCVEAYRPVAFTAGDELSLQADPLAQADAVDRTQAPVNRFPDRSTT